jgi:hypothetical protein
MIVPRPHDDFVQCWGGGGRLCLTFPKGGGQAPRPGGLVESDVHVAKFEAIFEKAEAYELGARLGL